MVSLLLPPLSSLPCGFIPLEETLNCLFGARFGGREAQADPSGHRNAPISVQPPAWPATPCWVRVTPQPQSHRPGCVSNWGWPAWHLGSSSSTLPWCLAFSHALISKQLWTGGLLIDAENTETQDRAPGIGRLTASWQGVGGDNVKQPVQIALELECDLIACV